MASALEDFLSGLLVELMGFALTSTAVYLIFKRREVKSQEHLVKAVYVRLKNKTINPFIAHMVNNLRSDVVRPSFFSSLLLDAPLASPMVRMEELQKKLFESFKNNDISGSMSARKEQWKIVIFEDFLMIMKRIVGYWSSKQWKGYYENLGRSLMQIRNLLDLYQSRLPSEMVSKLIEYENKVDNFTYTMTIFPEFFGRIDELRIPITSEFLATRRGFQYSTCESLSSIFKYIDELQKELE